MSAEMGICSRCGEKKRLTKDGLVYKHYKTQYFDDPVECKGSRKPSRAMLEKREFDKIIDSQPPDQMDVSTLWDGVKVLWPALHSQDGILVKGMILMECIDPEGYPNFVWVCSPYMSEWDKRGMIAQLKEELTNDSLAETVFNAIAMAQLDRDNDDEDDTEDEQ